MRDDNQKALVVLVHGDSIARTVDRPLVEVRVLAQSYARRAAAEVTRVALRTQ